MNHIKKCDTITCMRNSNPLLIRYYRFIYLLFHIISGLIQSVVYPHVNQLTQSRMMQRWARKFLNILNIQLDCHGQPPEGTIQKVLLIANHVSWLDICVLMAACPTRFVAKSEISNWPIVGLLCRKVGTLFIKRAKRRDTLRINQLIQEVLATGDRVTIFPEGTTSDGTVLYHFHASLLECAMVQDIHLYPIAISYRNMVGAISEEAAYENISLFESLQQILKQPRINASITFLQALNRREENRRELARLTESAIAKSLGLPIVHKKSGKPFDLPSE